MTYMEDQKLLWMQQKTYLKEQWNLTQLKGILRLLYAMRKGYRIFSELWQVTACQKK